MNARAPVPRPVNQPPAEEYNASNPEHIRLAEKTAKTRERERQNGLRKIVSDPESRMWLYDLLAFCGIGKVSMTGNSWTFFSEGQRNVGLKVQAELISNHPEAYVEMLRAVDVKSVLPPRIGERKDAEETGEI